MIALYKKSLLAVWLIHFLMFTLLGKCEIATKLEKTCQFF